jgi:glycolate oxidase FAD binding subunit
LKKKRGAIDSLPFDSVLRDALGGSVRILPDECAPFAVSGTVPTAVARPADLAQASTALAAASAEGAVVVLRGAGTKLHRPPPPHAVDLLLDVRGISGIVEHAAADLTVTLRPGTTLVQLEETLAGAGQFWPCDAPHHETATIGGTIAAGASGALRQRYGAVRDLILGASIAGADGTITKSGSRVVKSVAGYDIHKLLVGSFGTLGLIGEMTLKVAPLPETERCVVARFAEPANAVAAALELSRSPLFPTAMTLHDCASARRVGALLSSAANDRWMFVVRCGGNRRTVSRQIDGVVAACLAAGADGVSDLDDSATRRAWGGIRELAAGSEYPASRYVAMKIVSLPADTPLVLETLRAVWPGVEITAHAWAGVTYAHVPADSGVLSDGDLARGFERLDQQGFPATVLAAPERRARSMPLPAPPASLPVRLLRAVKAAIDPAGVLDPGRLAGGV